ncbi:hypothetical protein MPTK1_3g03900 [Marchantia polymorpha subsp. ruderalis]|uniref:Uncharacterized protein n=2 Tax=Marchantia polymorpha TaxID=3197 RepID=A0AAF6AX72_MARPO|nr:hypothetical protein MARPO_0022s0141 [Marchantia polymorpha]BBN04356.1 hypothetical protein Mp_3g03900 [Marchantia polymorpha subsp. ruderalis]|eukprot:PTQ44048.1 hypothetical protein MARPO_0022s0141 [Marchantia polymorpha]
MGRLLCTALVALVVFAAAAEAARHHEAFSQGTYYDQNQKITDQPEKVQSTDTTPVTVDNNAKDTPIDTNTPATTVDETPSGIPDRYPHGYPGSEQYNTQVMAEDTDPEARYSGYKTTNVQYSSVSNTETQDSTTVVPDRYPNGYPGSDNPLYTTETDPEAKFEQGKYVSYTSQSQDVNNDATTQIPDRYPHGYYGNADVEAETQGEADVYSSHQTDNHAKFSVNDKTVDYNSQTQTQPTVVPDRYPRGYYPGLNEDAQTDSSLTTAQKNQVSFQQYNNQPRFGYEGIQGDFSTQLQGTEIPFELTGGACPTQYWISNPQKWPKFFNINSKVTDAFGEKAAKVYGDTSLLDALTDSRADPYSQLVNSAATAILNSYTRVQYKYKHPKVIESFNAALVTPEAAKKQAADFEQSNVSVFSAGIGGSCN